MLFHVTMISIITAPKIGQIEKTRKQALHIQKQPSRGVLRKGCSENMQQIYRRTPLEHLFLVSTLDGCFLIYEKYFKEDQIYKCEYPSPQIMSFKVEYAFARFYI